MSTGDRPRVLVIDDDDAIRDVLDRMLSSMGCEVVAASCAGQAVAAYLAGSFDLVTLDHRMPGGKGMELHRLLSQEFGAGKPTTGFTPRKLPPILIVTGWADDPEVVIGQLGESIVGVLQKPVHMDVIERAVRAILGDRL